jgi:hypothetical protein
MNDPKKHRNITSSCCRRKEVKRCFNIDREKGKGQWSVVSGQWSVVSGQWSKLLLTGVIVKKSLKLKTSNVLNFFSANVMLSLC